MAYIPDQSVAGCVKDVMQRDRQFDDTEARPKMTAGDRDCIDCFGPQLISNLPELPLVQAPQIGWVADGIEEWS
jgi:hypothetical protein